MKLFTVGAAVALLVGAGGFLSLTALAADGEAGSKEISKPVAEEGKKECGEKKECGDAKKAECGEAKTCSDKDASCDAAGAECAKCVDGAAEGAEGKECCALKKATADLQVVALSVLNAEGKGWEAVVAAVPKAEADRVAKARTDAWTGLVKVRRAIEQAKAECKAVTDEAKVAGTEPACGVASAYDNDVKALETKARTILDGLAATVKEVVGADKVATLAEGVRKDGDVAKAVMGKVRAEAAKPVETEKKESAPSCGAGAGTPT